MYRCRIPRLKAHANGRNEWQQLPTLLAVLLANICYVRLHGPKSLTSFKLYTTSANIVGFPCKRTQQVTTLLGPTMLSKTLGVVGQQCWVRLHGPLDGISKSLLETSILCTAILK